MAFAYSEPVLQEVLINEGGKVNTYHRAYGTFVSSAGGTGGTIVTGLHSLIYMKTHVLGTSANLTSEDYNANGDDIDIVTGADENGLWMAIGKKIE